MAGFESTIKFENVNDAIKLVTHLQASKALNTARGKEKAVEINMILDLTCTQIITNADPDSIKAYQLAQINPEVTAAKEEKK